MICKIVILTYMPSMKTPISGLDDYFHSKRFIARLDKERARTKNEEDLKVYAFKVTVQLNLRPEHANVIHHYLTTGKYITDLKRPPLRVIDGVTLLKENVHRSRHHEANRDEYATFIEIDDDITKEALISLIDENWGQIKESLDKHAPDRIKRFTGSHLLNNHLTIAEEVNALPEYSHARAEKVEMLSDTYKIDPADIYEIARTYCDFLGN